jgi:hypothetical protein
MRRNLHAGGRPCNEGSHISRTFNPRMEYVTNQLEAHAWTRYPLTKSSSAIASR